MVRIIVSVIFIGLLFAGVTGSAAESENEKSAAFAVEKRLTLVDEMKYAESWKEASEYFKNSVNEEQWEQSVQAFRQPLGRLGSRKIKNKVCKTALPGAPDGEYVVIQFETVFANKKAAIETVTTMIDKDGKWRVSGYFIK
jgi:hypothetical protein